MTGTPENRQIAILDKPRRAMGAIQSDPRYDWNRFSDTICDAASSLMDLVERYLDGEMEEVEIKKFYRLYVHLHLKETS